MEQNSFPISIVASSANQHHDSTKFVDVMENISEFTDGNIIKEIMTAVYADKGYDSAVIRNYLKNRNNMIACISFRKNSKSSEAKSYKKYNSIRYVVERFFGWLKNGFHRTRIRYEKKCENYHLAFVNLASFLMYCRVLR